MIEVEVAMNSSLASSNDRFLMMDSTVKMIKFSSIKELIIRIVGVSNNCNNLLPFKSLSGRKQFDSKNSGFDDGLISLLSYCWIILLKWTAVNGISVSNILIMPFTISGNCSIYIKLSDEEASYPEKVVFNMKLQPSYTSYRFRKTMW